MTKETLDLFKELFEMIKMNKKYIEILDQQIKLLQSQINNRKD